MLQVSQAAVAAIEEARTFKELPDSAGVRVYGETNPAGEVEVSLAFADEPEEGDTVTDQDGTSIFIASEVVEPLAEAEIDLEQTPQGAGLVIKPQDEAS